MAATLKVDTIQNASSATANITLDTNGNATVGNTLAMGSSFLRNRIINGDMRIDQRNAGVAINPVSAQYLVDRWAFNTNQTKFSAQQNAGSVTPPSGFTNYLGFTSLSAFSSASTDYFQLIQRIEGFNVADLAWGTSSPKTITVSFWVYSSLTGSFSGAIRNATNYTYTYPFSFSVPSASTWTYVTVTIPGANASQGVWNTGNTAGLELVFDLGSGSNFRSTANSWQSGNYVGVTGSVSVVGTNGATFYITGVQLEVGSVATPFERRQYGQELALCQRYYQLSGCLYTVPAINNFATCVLQVPMRVAPTVVITNSFGVTGTQTVASPINVWGYPVSNSSSAAIGFTSTNSAEL